MNELPAASVVIPARNEGTVIGRCLHALLGDSEPGEFEVVVVGNGCSDDTVARVRAAAQALDRRVTVLDLPAAGKITALRAGEAHATALPRIYLDADVICPTVSARALLRALAEPGVELAVPDRVLDLSAAGVLVRRYFETWSSFEWVQGQLSGRGAYALNAAGRARFGAIPDVVADDHYVTSRIPREAARIVPGAPVTVFPPSRIHDVVRTRTRIFAGNRQLGATGAATGRGSHLARRTLRPDAWSGLAVYLPITALAKLRARQGGATGWGRDASGRRPAGGGITP